MAISVVQSAAFTAASGSPTYTLGSAPTLNNALICLATHYNNNPVVSSGWTQLLNTNATNAGIIVLIHWVQAGDGTTWTPFTTSGYNAGVVIEVANAGVLVSPDVVYGLVDQSVAPTLTFTASSNTTRANEFVVAIGADSSGGSIPTFDGSWTSITTITDGTRGLRAAYKALATSGSAITGTVTYGGSLTSNAQLALLSIFSSTTAAQASRVATEILTQGTVASAQASAVNTEVLTQGTVASAQASLVNIEVLSIGTGDSRFSGLIRETLIASTIPSLSASGLVRETLRTTGTGGNTWAGVDGLVRETLRSRTGTPWPVSTPGSYIQAMILA